MPVLVATGFEEGGRPIVWICSVCRESFALSSITPTPSLSDLHKINDNFRKHCEARHQGQKAIGLEIRNPKEDSSQAAPRRA